MQYRHDPRTTKVTCAYLDGDGGGGRLSGVVGPMTQKLKRGDRVQWSFRGRPVVGKVQRRLTSRTEIAGQVVAASAEDPRYVVKTEKSGKLTTRRPAALKKLRA
jgi:hypothetical protein